MTEESGRLCPAVGHIMVNIEKRNMFINNNIFIIRLRESCLKVRMKNICTKYKLNLNVSNHLSQYFSKRIDKKKLFRTKY